jgi:hypothetical protein
MIAVTQAIEKFHARFHLAFDQAGNPGPPGITANLLPVESVYEGIDENETTRKGMGVLKSINKFPHIMFKPAHK